MKLLIAGGKGQLGTDLERVAINDGFEVYATASSDCDITDVNHVETVITKYSPDVVVNAAAYTAVDKAETEAEKAFLINRDGATNLATVCQRRGIPLIHISTDYVFDGEKSSAYFEDDAANPTGIYGQSKWEGECAVRELCDKHIIFRVAWVFGFFGNNFVKTIQRLARERSELGIVADQRGCPTSTRSISMAIIQICRSFDNHWGTYHYVGKPESNWYEFAQAIVEESRQRETLAIEKINPITTDQYPTPAKRPANSVLNCDKIRETFGIEQSDWRSDLRAVIEELQ